MLEAQASAARNMPPRPPVALSDIDLESSRDSSVDSHSIAGTDVAGYFAGPHTPFASQPNFKSRAPPQRPVQHPNEAPWSPERRRSSLPDNGRGYPASGPCDRPTRTSFPPAPRDSLPHYHQRAASNLSTISTSTSDSSGITASSASLSPVHFYAQLHRPSSPGAHDYSTSLPRRPLSHPQGYLSPQRNSSGPPSRIKNVRWQDMDDVFDGPSCSPHRGGRPGRDMRHRYGRRKADEIGRGRPTRSIGPNTGVGGRIYAEGVTWR